MFGHECCSLGLTVKWMEYIYSDYVEINKQYHKGTQPLKMSAIKSYCNFGHFNSWYWHSDDRYPRFC